MRFTAHLSEESRTGGLLPGGHASRTRKTMNFTRMPIKRHRMRVIDQVSISFVMSPSQQPPTDIVYLRANKVYLTLLDEWTRFRRRGN